MSDLAASRTAGGEHGRATMQQVRGPHHGLTLGEGAVFRLEAFTLDQLLYVGLVVRRVLLV
ncbi:MAG: hypothetical protein M3076_17600 [Actinomycetota bacterium]|nr:hypothetical protein [Actinomycetota bacterium]